MEFLVRKAKRGVRARAWRRQAAVTHGQSFLEDARLETRREGVRPFSVTPVSERNNESTHVTVNDTWTQPVLGRQEGVVQHWGAEPPFRVSCSCYLGLWASYGQILQIVHIT